MATPKIIIDAGHGGVDPGACGNGIVEKDMTLQISLYQYQRLQELGIPVALTRNTDVTLDLTPRATMVANSGATVCICNHINAGGGDGAEVIHSIHNDGKLAQTIVNEIAKEGQNIRRTYSKESTSSPGNDYFAMHRLTGRVTTMIVEYGFLDSRGDDVTQLKSEWRSYAEACIRAVCGFYGWAYKAPISVTTPTDTATTTLYRVQVGAFGDKANAEQLLAALVSKGFSGYIVG